MGLSELLRTNADFVNRKADLEEIVRQVGRKLGRKAEGIERGRSVRRAPS